jgi:hypothetical protein
MVRLELADDTRRITGDDSARSHIASDHCPSGDYRAVPDGYPFEHNGTGADPHVVVDGDRSDNKIVTRQCVLIGVHDDDVASDLAISTYSDRTGRHDLRVSIEVGSIADSDTRVVPALQADTGKQRTITNLDLTTPVLDLRQSPATHYEQHACALQPRPKE